MRTALFPLPILLLPGGLSQLRIFEPRYKRLVSEATSSDSSFVLTPSMSDDDSHPYAMGVRVKIVDFDVLEDGLLGISIEARERVTLFDFQQASDGLHSAEFIPMANLPSLLLPRKYKFLSHALRQVMPEHPMYQEMDLEQEYRDLTWVVQRWLEMLPFTDDARRKLLNEGEVEHLAQVVTQVLDYLQSDEER